MSPQIKVRKLAIVKQLMHTDHERAQTILGIANHMIDSRHIIGEEQCIDAFEKLFSLSDHELNNVIAVLNLETRMVLASMLHTIPGQAPPQGGKL